VKAIADTGFLVALANRRDHHHAWAANLLPTLETPLLTCESVLSETAFHLGSSQLVLSMVRDGLVEVDWEFAHEWRSLQKLADQFADQEPDLADLCVIRLSELHPKHTVLTVDAGHFRIFRRNTRERIPTVFPPDM
jgi:predicted nucleic acid-binding protein